MVGCLVIESLKDSEENEVRNEVAHFLGGFCQLFFGSDYLFIFLKVRVAQFVIIFALLCCIYVTVYRYTKL